MYETRNDLADRPSRMKSMATRRSAPGPAPWAARRSAWPSATRWARSSVVGSARSPVPWPVRRPKATTRLERAQGALGGAAAGAVLGGVVAGPPGAVVGAAVGSGAGAGAGDQAEEEVEEDISTPFTPYAADRFLTTA